MEISYFVLKLLQATQTWGSIYNTYAQRKQRGIHDSSSSQIKIRNIELYRLFQKVRIRRVINILEKLLEIESSMSSKISVLSSHVGRLKVSLNDW